VPLLDEAELFTSKRSEPSSAANIEIRYRDGAVKCFHSLVAQFRALLLDRFKIPLELTGLGNRSKD